MYPKNWKEIAQKIKQSAGNVCEICESPSRHGRVLTVHHLNFIDSDCREVNLIAVCQVCHLLLQTGTIKYNPNQLYLFDPPKWVKKRLKKR